MNTDYERLEPKEDKIIALCTLCQGDIYEGEAYYDLPKLGCVCRDCIKDSERFGIRPYPGGYHG